MTPEDIQSKRIETLRQNNLKLTHQGIEIIEVLSKDQSHPSACMLFGKARKRVPSISMSTV